MIVLSSEYPEIIQRVYDYFCKHEGVRVFSDGGTKTSFGPYKDFKGNVLQYTPNHRRYRIPKWSKFETVVDNIEDVIIKIVKRVKVLSKDENTQEKIKQLIKEYKGCRGYTTEDYYGKVVFKVIEGSLSLADYIVILRVENEHKSRKR